MRTFMDEFDVVYGRTGGAEIIMSKKFPLGNSSNNGHPKPTNSDSAPHQEV